VESYELANSKANEFLTAHDQINLVFRSRALAPQVHGLGDLSIVIDGRAIKQTKLLLVNWDCSRSTQVVHFIGKQSRSLLAGRPRARVLHSRDIGQISTLSYMLGNLAAINGQEPAVRDLAAKGFISEQLAHAQQLPSDWDPPIGLHLT
jgi:hypothetical protein